MGVLYSFFSLQLLRVLNEPAVHVRTRGMKALSTIIAADPSILSRVRYNHCLDPKLLSYAWTNLGLDYVHKVG